MRSRARPAREGRSMDDSLEIRLSELGPVLAYPEPTTDLASGVTQRLRAGAAPSDVAIRLARRPAWWSRLTARPVRRSVLLAIAALLLLAAAVTAAVIGLPGIRIVFLSPTATPGVGPSSPVSSPSP